MLIVARSIPEPAAGGNSECVCEFEVDRGPGVGNTSGGLGLEWEDTVELR
jgi:hypothetical protein